MATYASEVFDRKAMHDAITQEEIDALRDSIEIGERIVLSSKRAGTVTYKTNHFVCFTLNSGASDSITWIELLQMMRAGKLDWNVV